MREALRLLGLRTAAFFVKEAVVTLGQRRLILSVIVGPFLLLALFGLGFTSKGPPFRTVLVVPDRANVPTDLAFYRPFFLWSLQLVDVSTDKQHALDRLRRRDVDAVVVAPTDPIAALADGRPAIFHVYYNHLDPVDSARIGSLAYGETRELNAHLEAAVLAAGLRAAGVQPSNRTALDALRERMLAGDSAGALAIIDQLQTAVYVVRSVGEQFPGTLEGTQARGSDAQLQQFTDNLAAVRAVVRPQAGLTAEQQRRLAALEQSAARLPDVVRVAANITPSLVATPTDFALTNLVPSTVSYANFYAPVVVALLLQHVAVTLATLSVIRERTHGTMELFAVAPIRLSELLVGKALSFFAMVAVLGVILVALMLVVLHVPLLGSPLLVALIFALLIVVSLAFGFIIAALSTTESQAVQLAMLFLLFTVFFGGLFIPLSGLLQPIHSLAYGVPLTHAGNALRVVMLKGYDTPWDSIGALALMAALLCPLASLLMRRSLGRRAHAAPASGSGGGGCGRVAAPREQPDTARDRVAATPMGTAVGAEPHADGRRQPTWIGGE